MTDAERDLLLALAKWVLGDAPRYPTGESHEKRVIRDLAERVEGGE